MTANCTNERTGRVKPRANELSGVPSAAQPATGATHVAHGREAFLEVHFQHTDRANGQFFPCHVRCHDLDIRTVQGNVGVPFDHAGHERAATPVDHCRARRVDRFGRDGLDQVVFDEDVGVLNPRLVHTVKDVDVGKQRLRGLVLRLCGHGCQQQSRKGKRWFRQVSDPHFCSPFHA